MNKHLTVTFAPDSIYTRHSEGAFIRLKDGRIMFAYSRFTGTQSDDAPSDIIAYFSGDEGETWTGPKVLIKASMYNTENVMSVSLMRMQNGDVGLFYIVKRTPAYSSIMLSRSNDECESFYKHVECTVPDRAGYYVLNNDRVERLSTGRIIVPLAFHRTSAASGTGKCYMDSRSEATFVYSDDDGETWSEAPEVVFPPFGSTGTGLQETGVIEKQNGVLWAYNRTDKMYQYEYFSMDGGLHWTLPQPSRFTSPPSPLKIKRHPETGALYAFWNPIPLYNGREKGISWGRTPFVYAISCNDGMSWSDCGIIEDAPDHGYCYPAVFFTDDDALLVAYCAGGPEDGICLSRTNIMKIPCDGRNLL